MASTRPGLPTSGPHVFVPPVGTSDDVELDGAEGHHLADVLRVGTGDPVSLADDTGTVYACRVAQVGRGRVRIEIVERHDVPPPRVSLCVVQALPKGRKVEEVVQRLTEIGVDRIRVVVSQRTVRRPDGKGDRLLRRWQEIARAAAQQSRRPRLPVLDPIGPWPEDAGPGVVLWEQAHDPLAAVVTEMADQAGAAGMLTVAVGPEGGLSEQEVQACGLAPVTVGPTILRTETAGLVGAVLASHALAPLR